MSADIGARIGIDGEKAFKDSLAALNSQMKSLGSEMKAVISTFAGMEDSEEAVKAKNDLLQKSLDVSGKKMSTLQEQSNRAKKRLAELANELDNAKREFGENSAEATKAQNAYNRQVVVANRLETQINNTRAEMSRMEREMKSTGKAADNMAVNLQKAGREADSAGDSFRDAFVGGLLSGAVQSLASGVASLVDETTEYRKVMGTLDTSSQKAGYSAEQTAETYRQLYGVLGDNQQTATTTANLQALQLEQDKLKQLTDGVIGAWATYGDSIPIDGLAEAVNETAKVGKVTGSFADVLNWAGTSEDAFNEKLAAAGSQAERVNIILEELSNQGLMNAAEKWRENNAEILAANEAAATLEQTTGRLGEMLSPMVTGLKQELADVLGTVLDMVETGNPLVAMVTGLAVALSGMGIATAVVEAGGFVVVLGKMTTGIHAVNAAMKANPILLVASLLAGLVAALITAYQTNDEFKNSVDAAWLSLKNGVGEKVEAVKGYIEALKTKFRNFINDLKNIPKEMKTLGSNIITGLWDGLDSKIQWVKNKAKGAVDGIKNVFTGVTGFDTHSPSKWAKKLADWIMKGLGIGFEEDETAVTAAQTATDDVKEIFEGTAEEIEKNAEKIAAAVDTMEEKLSDYGDLFETVSDENGGRFIKLKDMQESVNAIKEYGNALQTLKGKGVSEGLFKEITDMDVDSGMGYMKELLKMSDEDLDTYVALFEEKQKAAAEIAQQFYGIGAVAAQNLADGMANATETNITEGVSTATTGAGTSTQAENMTEVVAAMQEQEPVLTGYIQQLEAKLIEMMKDFQGDYIDIGELLMEGVEVGIKNGESGVVRQVAASIRAAIRAAREEADINSPSGEFEEIGHQMAAGADVGWVDRIKATIKNVRNSLATMAQMPKVAMATAGSASNTRTINYGDVNVTVGSIKSEREAKIIAQEIEFIRRQEAAGKGGIV